MFGGFLVSKGLEMTFYNFDGYKTQKMNDIMRDILKRHTILVKKRTWIIVPAIESVFFLLYFKDRKHKKLKSVTIWHLFLNASNWIRSCHLLTR